MRKINGKKVILIGATGGMGKVISKMLFDERVDLYLADINKIEVENLANTLSDKNEVKVFEVDATKEESVEMLMKSVGDADIMINLAGISIPAKIESMQEDDYNKTMDINVKTVFFASKYFLQIANKEGLIINIGSMAARRPNGNAPLYCAAKAAVNSLSAGIAIQALEKGVRVTTLNPGGADTAFWGERKVPREKMLKPEDIAEVIKFIMKTDSRVAVHCIDFESFSMMS